MADQRALRDNNRTTALIVQDSTGAETRQIRSTLANPNAMPVDIVAGTVTATVTSIGSITTSVTPGTAAANLGKAEDAVHSSGDTGVFSLSVANEAQTTLAADGDYIAHAADTKGNSLVVGNVASSATDAGSPVKVGAVNRTTQPTLTDGQRGDMQLDTRANLKTTLVMGNTATLVTPLATNADAVANTATASYLGVVNRNTVFNGSTFDRMRGDTTGVNIAPYPSGATVITAASGNVANASAAATLAGTSGKTTYITGFTCTGSGSTAGQAVTITVTGTISGTLSYTFVAPTGVLVGGTPVNVQFSSPIPASTTNTAIVVTMPALGAGNTNATTVATGFQL